MKRIFALILVLAMAMALIGCGKKSGPDTEKGEGVMTYDEYMAAAVDTEVVVEAYIQGKQVYAAEYGNTSLYLADADGAYFIYRLPCTADEYEKLAVGQKIKVTGYKSEWAGEVEIIDAAFEVEDGSWTDEATDVTAMVGTDELAKYQNKLVVFKGAVVESEAIYNWDGSGTDGDDLYINFTVNGQSVSFTVETDDAAAADVYEAVKGLKVGDTADITCFLYWYDTANPHIQGLN